MKKVLLLIILSGLIFFLSISNVSAASPANFTTDEIASASVTVKNQIETTKTLPNNVNIGNYTVNTAQYLHLAVQATNQINTNNKTPIPVQSDTAPSYQEEQLNTGSMPKTDYLDFARRIDGHMDDNHQAPPYGLIGLGKVSYSSQVYLYSRILTIYKNYGSLPPNINLKAWSAQNIPITETQSFSFTPNQIVSTADGLKNAIESTKTLPSTVTVAGVNINTAQFLHLAVQATTHINNNSTARITLQSDSIPGNQEEQLNTGIMTKADYLDFAQRINTHINNNHQAPPYGLIGLGKISYSSQVYLYSRILSVYKTYGSLPLAITVKPWSTANIPIGYTTFTVAQVIDAAVNLKNSIESTKILPSNVIVGGKTINTGQFLHLVVQATNQIKNNNNQTLLLEDDSAPSYSEESLSCGSLSIADYVDFAQRIDNYMDNNHQAPPYGLIGLGKTSYQNMVYVFCKILTSYHTSKVLPSAMNVKPWVEVINPVKNSRTAKRFSTIQAAINDATTLNGDILILGDSVYKENVLVNKKLTIKPESGINIIVRALNSSKPVFTLNYLGNSTTIQSLTITGATNSSGIYLTGTSSCNLIGNNIIGNSHGIYLYNSKNNLLSGNIVKNNTYSGIIFADSNYNTIKSNDASKNPRGIRLTNSHYNTLDDNTLKNIPNYAIGLERSNNNNIQNNDLMGNQYGMYIGIIGSVTGSSNNNLIQNNTLIVNQRGIYLHNSTGNFLTGNILIQNQYGIQLYNSSANINFNIIIEPSIYGLYSTGNRTVNASNNWWGTNNPTVSSSTGSDIYIASGTVNYNPWIVLNVTAVPTVVSNGESTINVDLTRNNQGGDTSSQGHIPNGLIVNLSTNLGSVTGSVSINKGKATAKFYRLTSTSGTATIKTTLNKQTVQTSINIDTTAPTVTANPAGGTYNTTKSVTLTATDNLDPNPTIYYTINGSNPTTSSTKYTAPLSIVSTTTLKFMAVDKAGNQAATQTQNYIVSIVTNTNTGKTYSTIQDAVNDPLTLNNHTIMVKSGTYSGNFVINKKLIIKPVNGCNVILQALNPSEPVFKINLPGNGTTIQGFTIKGATNSSGVYVTGSSNCNLVGNNFTSNKIGIFLSTSNNTIFSGNTFINNTYASILFENSNNNLIYNNTALNNQYGIRFGNSNQNLIQGNTLRNNATGYGVGFEKSSNNTILNNVITGNVNGIYIGIVGSLVGSSNDNFIQNNTLTSNQNGITLYNSTGNTLYQNTLTSNQYGVYCYYSSSNISFNRIVGNSRYGIYKVGTGMVNATNNWWGTNSPLVSSNYGSALYTPGGSVNSSSWIVMNLTGSIIHVTKNNTSQSEITADLTHNNQGKDTSSSGTIPDGIPVNFTTTVGIITPTKTTRRGKATVTLTSSPSSAATTVSATLDNQTISKAFRKSFNTIQSAINDPLTVNGDVIVVANGTYTENILVNKNLTIISEGDVTVQALNSLKPIFTINKGGSGLLLQGFVISGSVNNYGILLDGSSNCTISGNTITNNYFGILTTTVKTENNVIMNNNITSNQIIGLGTCNSDDCVIYGNTITYNRYGGIELLDSNNNIVHTNLIMSNDGPGIFISNLNNTVIQNNLILGNVYGLYIEYCRNCTVYGNLIAQGIVGMYVNSSVVDINFNRIASNSQYELISEQGNVNATNNWWGSNSNPVNLGEIVFTGYVNYNPWLMLSIDPSSTVNSGGNTSITADLTHNNLGQDTSSLGHVIKGLPITFGTSYGTILTPALTFNGKAVAILNLGTTASRTVTVNASLDSQTVSRQMVIATGVATLNITSTALNSTTLQPISLICDVPLNSSVSWLSVLWKNTQYLFYCELQVIVNGAVVKSIGYVNPGYNTWKNSGYHDDVFRAIMYTNNYILQDGIDPTAIPVSFWNDLTSLYSLTSTELQFIQNHRQEFMDNLTVKLTYHGAVSPAMTVTDPVTNSTINLNFTGGTVLRTSPIMYMDGFGAGYEGVKSFAIATTKINDDILTYWLNQNSTYPVGAMKAAYGTFLTALLVEYCHDQVADVVSSECNVTWTRTHPIAISVGDDAYQTYLTLECDHSMGMNVMGSLKNTILFNYICSSAISPIEYGVMNNLGLKQISTTNSSVNSVVMDLFKDINNKINLLMFIQNGYIIIKSVGNNSNFLVIDPETGTVRDINTVYNYYGAYCFHDQLTSQSYEQGENFQEKGEYANINMMVKYAGGLSKVCGGIIIAGRSVLVLGFYPVGTVFGAAGIVVGGLGTLAGVWQIQDALDDPWVTNRSYKEQATGDWLNWIRSYLGAQ